MELIDIVGPWYPCSFCWMPKEDHGDSELGSLGIKHPFTPAPLEKVLNFSKFACSPLQDIASRLKAL